MWEWGLNIAGGIAAAGVRIGAIFIPGVGEAAAPALIGGAIGALAIMCFVVIEDYNDGEARDETRDV